jgi:hypothetical protein
MSIICRERQRGRDESTRRAGGALRPSSSIPTASWFPATSRSVWACRRARRSPSASGWSSATSAGRCSRSRRARARPPTSTNATAPGGEDTNGLARQFDCEDQRELEFCHPRLLDPVPLVIGYLPNTTATWLTPQTLEEIEYVIINQPGDAARIMNFAENFGTILKLAGFVPGAEFYAPDPNPLLVGTPQEGTLIRQQVLGAYTLDPVAVTSTPVTQGLVGGSYSYRVETTGSPEPTLSLTEAPDGMTLSDTGLVKMGAQRGRRLSRYGHG